MARCRSEAAAAANDGRAQALRAMAAELAAVEAAAEGYEGKHGQAVAAIHSLQAAVLDMFNRCGCVCGCVFACLRQPRFEPGCSPGLPACS